MSPALIGAGIGAIIGLTGYAALRAVADRVERSKDAKDPLTTAKALRLAALVDLVIFPVAGFFIGPMFIPS